MCCIGVGGGGNVCLQDVTEFCETLVDNVDVTGQINFEKIRTFEERIIERRNLFIKRRNIFGRNLIRASPGKDPRKMTLCWTFVCVLLTIISNTLVFLEGLFFGKVGSPRPIKS